MGWRCKITDFTDYTDPLAGRDGRRGAKEERAALLRDGRRLNRFGAQVLPETVPGIATEMIRRARPDIPCS